MLFLVSAGNCVKRHSAFVARFQRQRLRAEQLRDETLRAMRDAQVERRPLSPAEAINVVTVGASTPTKRRCRRPIDRVDLLADE